MATWQIERCSRALQTRFLVILADASTFLWYMRLLFVDRFDPQTTTCKCLMSTYPCWQCLSFSEGGVKHATTVGVATPHGQRLLGDWVVSGTTHARSSDSWSNPRLWMILTPTSLAEIQVLHTSTGAGWKRAGRGARSERVPLGKATGTSRDRRNRGWGPRLEATSLYP